MHLVKRLQSEVLVSVERQPKFPRRARLPITEELCLALPIITSALAGGASIVSALAEASEPATGRLAETLRAARNRIEDGESIKKALEDAAHELRHPGVTELVSKLTQALTLGTPVVAQLHELARTEQQGLDQIRLRNAAKAETRMLIPLVFLILPVSVLFALYPSLSMLQNIN